VIPAVFSEKDVLGRKKFDQYKNSPLYGPKDINEAFFKITGLFGDTVEALTGAGLTLASKVTGEGELTPGKEYDMYTKFLTEGVSLLPWIPFRGDIAKTIRKMRQTKKRELNESGEFRRRSRERKWRKRGQLIR
jgi:hypothetical protein